MALAWMAIVYIADPSVVEQFRYSHAIQLLKFVQEVSTSGARFFAAAAGEPLLVLVSLSLSGVLLRLSGLLT